MTLPAGSNIVLTIAFLAVAAAMIFANWGRRSRL